MAFSRKHYRLLSNPDTPDGARQRAKQNAVLEQVRRERTARYLIITPDNIDEVNAWQEARIEELMQP